MVIGAGISGLFTASLLQKQGIDFRILEASGTHRGRIISNIETSNIFSDLPIELGADEILGSHNSWYNLV